MVLQEVNLLPYEAGNSGKGISVERYDLKLMFARQERYDAMPKVGHHPYARQC